MSTGNSVVDSIIETTIGHEGGYSNNANDTGGATKWGITESVARNNGYKGDMRQLPRETAISIYEKSYWYAPKFDQIADVSPTVAAKLFDAGVNMGVTVPVKFLQRWLNAFNNQGKLYQDITADGKIGPATIQAFKAYLNSRGKDAEKVMLRAINCSQGARYLEISEARTANETFTYGWMLNRVGSV